MPKVIQVIENEETDGNGTDKNPYRMVRRYYTLEGKFLAEYDHWKEPIIALKDSGVTEADVSG